MKILICILPALFAAAVQVSAIGSRTDIPETCDPMVPEECLRSDPIAECPTCCCASEDVEFYDPDVPEPECTAEPAIYEVKFVATWSPTCHPDYYFDNSIWSPHTGASHNPEYRMWDACMDNVTQGVAIVSQTGGTSVINMEYEAAGDRIYDTTEGQLIPDGSGISSSYLTVDKDHQWVSVISMLIPSVDRMVGVADLRLCDGTGWKQSVRVCTELFSTATKSDRVAPDMERNTVQYNNCSFGYFDFTFKELKTRPSLEETCFPMVPEECLRSDPIDACPTCCCESSEDVEFYDPNAPEPECTADPALYEIKFVATWSPTCHPDYYFDDSIWSPPTGASHNPEYKMWDACMDDVSQGVAIVSQTGNTSVINMEYVDVGDSIYATTEGQLIPDGSGISSSYLTVDKDHQLVSVISMLIPSVDRMVGVADLRLCDGTGWKQSVRVCTELFSTATKSDRVAPDMERNSVQVNNCSFGYFDFTFKELKTRPPLEETCYPMVPEECLRSDPIDDCLTCCCESSEDVEFYNPDAPEPECTAQPALYDVRFVATWSPTCHPDYYFDNSVWSPPTGASHNIEYRMWDACMDNVTEGVAIVSQTGGTSVINMEYEAAGDTILDTTEGDMIPDGSGTTTSSLVVDKNHQWVSVISMLIPSVDRMVGVADLRLCDGTGWKQSVKVCTELFSTATKSDRVAPDMERNSVQVNNCSFGYFDFTFKELETRPPLEETCYPMVPEECLRSDPIDACPTCCCESSEDVEFYNPDAPEPECTADPITYEVKFVATWSPTCHPDYYFDNSVWSPPTGASHNPEYNMWDACMDNVSPGVAIVSQTGGTSVINMEYEAAGDTIFDTTEGDMIPDGSGTTMSSLAVDKDHQWVSVISMLIPSADRMVGVADLRLCDGNQWKKTVRVCTELFSTATKSDRVAANMERNTVQYNNCSFGYFEFTSASEKTAPVTMLLAVLAFVATVFHHM